MIVPPACAALWRRRSAVGVVCALLITAQTLLRLIGPSWFGVTAPVALRELEGHTVAWESYLQVLGSEAVLGSDEPPRLGATFNSEQYRTMVPTYVAAILRFWLRSTYWAFLLTDVVLWWIAACLFWALTSRLGATYWEAWAATALFILSPIAIHQLGANTTHVAQSVSLVPAFFAALAVMEPEQQSARRRGVLLGAVLFGASLFYNYDWIVAAYLVALSLLARRRAAWIGAAAIGIAIDLALTWVARSVLAAAGTPLHPHLNDPVFVLRERLSAWSGAGFPLELGGTASRLTGALVDAYEPLVFGLALVGFLFARWRLRLLFITGNLLALAGGLIYQVPWLMMHAYPFVYPCAALALSRVPVTIARGLQPILGRRVDRGPLESRLALAAAVATCLGLLLAIYRTNLDVFGDYSFVVRWWSAARAER